MKKNIVILVFFFIASSVFSQDNKVYVENNDEGSKLIVNGKPFMINGMNWDYVPIGTNVINAEFYKKSDDIIKAGLDAEMSLLQNMLNFVAIEFYGRDGSGVQPVDASDMTHIHIDIRPNEAIEASDFFRIEIFNNFTLGNQIAGTYTISGSELTSNDWVGFDIPLSSFSGLSSQDALGAMIFVSDGTIVNVSLDNIYFYSEN